jgi:hypothetical protein
MERQWRDERRAGGTDGSCGSWAGFWATASMEIAAITVSSGQRINEGTVSSRMTEENTAKGGILELALESSK